MDTVPEFYSSGCVLCLRIGVNWVWPLYLSTSNVGAASVLESPSIWREASVSERKQGVASVFVF